MTVSITPQGNEFSIITELFLSEFHYHKGCNNHTMIEQEYHLCLFLTMWLNKIHSWSPEPAVLILSTNLLDVSPTATEHMYLQPKSFYPYYLSSHLFSQILKTNSDPKFNNSIKQLCSQQQNHLSITNQDYNFASPLNQNIIPLIFMHDTLHYCKVKAQIKVSFK